MAHFADDTAVTGSDGRYSARLSPEWEVWGPLGGYIASIALRALAAESRLVAPATFACQFLAVGRFEDVEVHVTPLRRGRRSEAASALVIQGDRTLLAASAWFVEPDMPGFVHSDASMPEVPGPDELRSFSALADDYDDWFPIWRHLDGRPVTWSEEPGLPRWACWLRLGATPPLDDPALDAARTLMWLDFMGWNAAVPPHMPWPTEFLAPNLDLTVQFHQAAAQHEWLLCEAHSPHAQGGLVGSNARIWSPDGRLVATGTSQLFCRPNPEVAQA